MQGRAFSEYVEEFRTSGKLSFESPVLVLHGAGEQDYQESDITAMGREANRMSLDWLAQEAAGGRSLRPSAAAARAREDLTRVYVISKRPGNAFDYISLGRAPHLDVVMYLQRVSKFHAYVLRESAQQFLLADAGSTNGTWIGPKRLSVRKPEPVNEGERIRLGPYAFTFHTPTGFTELVKQRAR